MAHVRLESTPSCLPLTNGQFGADSTWLSHLLSVPINRPLAFLVGLLFLNIHLDHRRMVVDAVLEDVNCCPFCMFLLGFLNFVNASATTSLL